MLKMPNCSLCSTTNAFFPICIPSDLSNLLRCQINSPIALQRNFSNWSDISRNSKTSQVKLVTCSKSAPITNKLDRHNITPRGSLVGLAPRFAPGTKKHKKVSRYGFIYCKLTWVQSGFKFGRSLLPYLYFRYFSNGFQYKILMCWVESSSRWYKVLALTSPFITALQKYHLIQQVDHNFKEMQGEFKPFQTWKNNYLISYSVLYLKLNSLFIFLR